MNVSFKSRKFEKTCNSDKGLLKAYGKVCAGKLRARLDDLSAAASLDVFRTLPGRCHELKGDRQGQLSLDLEHPLRLIFLPSGEGVLKMKDGGLDWSSVKGVEVIEVVDTHD